MEYRFCVDSAVYNTVVIPFMVIGGEATEDRQYIIVGEGTTNCPDAQMTVFDTVIYPDKFRIFVEWSMSDELSVISQGADNFQIYRHVSGEKVSVLPDDRTLSLVTYTVKNGIKGAYEISREYLSQVGTYSFEFEFEFHSKENGVEKYTAVIPFEILEGEGGAVISGGDTSAVRTDTYFIRIDPLDIGYNYVPCDNSAKMAISSVQHLPIKKISSLSELELYKGYLYDSVLPDDGFKTPYYGNQSFDGFSKKYDDGYFSENCLFLICFYAGSGTYRYRVSDIIKENESFYVEIEQMPIEEVLPVTDDIACWLAAVEVKRSDAENYTDIDAWMK